MLQPHGDLAAAQVAFFAPALLLSAFIVLRHGLSRKLGWFYLVLLSILRLVGAACTIYMEVKNDYSPGLLTTAAITSAVGTAPLLLALMGFLERINEGMEHKGFSLMIFRPIHLTSLAALIIAIIGGINESDSSASDQKTGKELMEAASILFLAIYLGLAGIALRTVCNVRWVLPNEKKLLQACVIALPFLLVRTAYSVCAGFSSPGSTFYFRDVNVYVQAFMQFLMEAIVVCIFIFAGLMTPKMETREILDGSKDVEGHRMEILSGPTQESGREPRGERQASRPQMQPPRHQQEQQQRNLGDYRPSRLIMNAINRQ